MQLSLSDIFKNQLNVMGLSGSFQSHWCYYFLYSLYLFFTYTPPHLL